MLKSMIGALIIGGTIVGGAVTSDRNSQDSDSPPTRVYEGSTIEEQGFWADLLPSTSDDVQEELSTDWLTSNEPYDEESSGDEKQESGAAEGDQLRYNAMEDRFEYASPNAGHRYNAMEDRFELAEEEEQLRYNAMEDRFEYAGDDERVRYNALEDRFEHAGNDDVTRYNAMEDRFELVDP